MIKPHIVFFFSFFLTNLAWAGFGPVNITENTAGSGQQEQAFSLFLPSPFVSIKPSGNGQLVFARHLSATGALTNITTEIYAQPVDQSNQLSPPILLVDDTAHNVPLIPVSLLSANNGNAVFHYVVNFDASVSDDEQWTIYYDALSGWRQPIQLAEKPYRAQLFIDSVGTTYALVEPTQNSLFNLYQYQANNSWLLVSEAFPSSNVGMGANDRLYRIYNGNTVATTDIQYLSFFDPTNSQWQTPIVINQDAENNVIDGVTLAGINAGGDIFTMYYSISEVDFLAALNMRKYEADSQTWSITPDTLDLPISMLDFVTTAQLLSYFSMSSTANGSTSFISLAHRVIDPDHSEWFSIHYSEQSGWRATQTAQDVPNGDDVEIIATTNFSLANIYVNATNLGYLRTDSAGNVAMFFCRNSCADVYAKIYTNNTGWSNELYLPALSRGSDNTCKTYNLGYKNPNIAMHSNGKLVAVSEYTTGANINDERSYFATMTGDILSAFSDTTCPFENSNQEPTDPGTTDPGPADPGTTDPAPGGDSGGTDSGTDSGNGNGSSGGSTGGDSGGSLSLPFILLITLLFGLRFRTPFKRKSLR